MLQIISLGMILVGLIFFVMLSWSLHCSTKTHKHRMQIITWLFAHNNYKELLSYYEAVDYRDHMRALIWLRDPFKLYDPELFSTFHMIKHGPCTVDTSNGKEIICPYTPE